MPTPLAITNSYTSSSYNVQSYDSDVRKCPHCGENCFYGEQFCGKCGKSLSSDDDEDPQDGVLYGPNNENYFN